MAKPLDAADFRAIRIVLEPDVFAVSDGKPDMPTDLVDKETLVLSDIGSGLKANRRHLQRLLKLVCKDKVAEVVITYEDRLTRFGHVFLETLFRCFGVTLTMVEPGEEKTPKQELKDDLLALIASFSGRLYGMRSHKQKELLQCAQAVLTSP